MKPYAFFLMLLLIGLFHGCIPSLHPLYTKDKIVYLNQLEGKWTDSEEDLSFKKFQTTSSEGKDIVVTMANDDGDQPAVWDFRNNNDNGYLLVHRDNKGREAAFDIYVVKLGDDYFMDFYLTDMPSDEPSDILDVFDNGQNELAVFHTIPVHTFAKLILVGNELKVQMFDPDFLDKLFKQRQIRIKHERLDDGNYVLTAPPEELQKFVEKYADNKEAYIIDAIVLNKQP